MRFGIYSEDKAFRASLRQAVQAWSAGVCAEVTSKEWPDWPSFLNDRETGACGILFWDADSWNVQLETISDRLHGVGALFICSDSRLAAIDSYALHPNGFLTKQVTAEVLERSLYPCFHLWKEALCCLDLSIGRNRVSLPICELIWAEAMGRSCVLHSAHGQITANESLLDLAAHLPPDIFLRCQKSFLVNLRHIRAVGNGILTMSDGAEVPVGRNCRNAVFQAHTAFRSVWTSRHTEI